jgi:hypothetical protein
LSKGERAGRHGIEDVADGIRLLVCPIRPALGLDQLLIQRLKPITIIGIGRGNLGFKAGDVVAALDALPQFVLNKIGNAERVVHA